ncbi:MAG: hypothetical protein ACHQD9_03335 [Chitinophagales bacterium]
MKNENSIEELAAAGIFDTPLFLVPDEEEIKSFSLAEPVAECKLLVILKDEKNEKVSEKDRDLLNKIADWKDLNLKRNEVIVINSAKQNVKFTQLISKFHSPAIISFGVAPEEIGLHIEFPASSLFSFRKTKFIFTLSLQKLEEDATLKKKFFLEALRPMFK